MNKKYLSDLTDEEYKFLKKMSAQAKELGQTTQI